VHRPDRVGDLVQRDVLEQVAARAGPDRLEEILLLVADREDDDLGARGGLLDRPAGLDPVAAGHADVHQDDVGQRLGGLLDRLRAVARLADQIDIRLALQDHLETAAEQGVIIDDHRADGLRVRRGILGCHAAVGASAHDASSLTVRSSQRGSAILQAPAPVNAGPAYALPL
jgi:hypothetical protein